MDIKKSDLLSAAEKLGMDRPQTEALWNMLEKKAAYNPTKFDLSHILYYFGAMIVIIAMGWFVDMAWESFGGAGILTIALAYILLFILAGSQLWHKKDLKTPGGLLITMAVCLIPLAVYGFQRWTGLWLGEEPGPYKDFVSWIRGGWFMMEMATIIGACIALKFYPFPFLTAPLFFSLWFMSMDMASLIFGSSFNMWENQVWFSIGFGAILLVIAYLIDLKTYSDFAFWGYLFGTITVWSGFTILNSALKFNDLAYLLINLSFILLAVLLERVIFLILGSIGVLIYLSSLFYLYFADSAWFPIVLSSIGIGILCMGILYHKNRNQIEAFLLKLLPKSILKWLPRSKRENSHVSAPLKDD